MPIFLYSGPFWEEGKRFAAERDDFIAQNRRFVDEYRRQVTGAQASQAELARIEQRLMNAAENGKVQWMTMFNTIIKEQNRKMNRERKRMGMDLLPMEDNMMFSESDIDPTLKVDKETGESLENW